MKVYEYVALFRRVRRAALGVFIYNKTLRSKTSKKLLSKVIAEAIPNQPLVLTSLFSARFLLQVLCEVSKGLLNFAYSVVYWGCWNLSQLRLTAASWSLICFQILGKA